MKRVKKFFCTLISIIFCFSWSISVFCTENESSAQPTQQRGSITINHTTPGRLYNLYKIFDLTLDYSTEPYSCIYTIDKNWKEFFSEDGIGSDYLSSDSVDFSNSPLNPVKLDDGTTKYIYIVDVSISRFNSEALSYALSSIKNENGNEPNFIQIEAEGETVKINNVNLGYYLIYPVGATESLPKEEDPDVIPGSIVMVETQPSLCSLTNTTPDATVNIKSTYPSISQTADKKYCHVGDQITYTIESKIPDITGYSNSDRSTNYKYSIEVIVGEGLTLDTVSVTQPTYDSNGEVTEATCNLPNILRFEIGDASPGDGEIVVGPSVFYEINPYTKSEDNSLIYNVNNDYSLIYEENVDKNKFTILMNMGAFQDGGAIGQKLTLVYTATVNEEAPDCGTLLSQAILRNSINPSNLSAIEKNVASTFAYNFNITVDKYCDNIPNIPKFAIAGTKFQLYKKAADNSANEYYVRADDGNISWSTESGTILETDKNGYTKFTNLLPGQYYLEEIWTPPGYNTLLEPISVEIVDENTFKINGISSEYTSNDSQNLLAVVGVVNRVGKILPEAGGKGTFILIITGVALTVSAGIFLLKDSRSNEKIQKIIKKFINSKRSRKT